MRNLAFIALLALSGFAQATNNHNNDGCRGNCVQPSESTAVSGSVSDADANATAISGAIAGANADVDVRNSNTNVIGVGVDVSNKTYNTNLNANANDNRDYNSNTNVAYGGRGGDGGDAYAKGGDALSVQGQDQAQEQSQSQSASANNAQANSQSINIEAPKTWRYSNNVNALAPSIYSSSACTGGGVSGAASALGVGVSLGGAKQDPQCQVRENARILAGLDAALAIEYLCKNDKVDIGAVLGAACKPPVLPEPPVVLPEQPIAPEPPVEVIESVKG